MDINNKELVNILESFSLIDDFILFGQSNDINTILNGIDLNILSSRYGEAFPNVIAEAMLSETPCIATNVGDVKFYVASNKANGNNQDNGDMIYLSQHTISAPSNVGLEESNFKPSFKAAYNSETNSLKLNYKSLKINKVNVNVVDLSGKSVFHKSLGVSAIGENTEFVSLPNDLPKGYYVVNVFLNNSAISAKVLVQ
jgi:hypothetical protein